MPVAHRKYLNSVPAEQQFPAIRCAMGDDICMHGHEASSGSESMNNANEEARNATAVDILNASLILIQKESERFEKGKQAAWKDTNHLTPRGMKEMEEAFSKCNVSIYTAHKTENTHDFTFAVSKKAAADRIYTVVIPKQPGKHGSRFGSCTCGFPKKEGLPCEHMVFIVKVGNIPGLSRLEIMPYWYTTLQWRLQFPNDIVCKTITLKSIKSGVTPNQNIKACPDWVGAKKKGRPKKAQRLLGVADLMAKAAKKKGGKRKKSKEGDTTGMSAVEGAANLNLNFELEDVKVGGLKAEV